MARVIGISGKKQSGKTSLAQYLKAMVLKERYDRYKSFEIIQNEEGEVYFGDDIGLGQMDLHPISEIENSPIEVYSFGDTLKDCCMDTLGLTYEQCHGTDEQKNTFTKYLWDNLSMDIRLKYSIEKRIEKKADQNMNQFGFRSSNSNVEVPLPREGHMSGREVMQVFGTDICRNMFHDDIWVDATFNKIKKDNIEIAIIADVRFPSEVNAIIDQSDHQLIRLSRNKNSTDTHDSETSLDNFEWQDLGHNVLMVDNEKLEMETKNNLVYDWLFKQKEIVNG